jgi:hypothetical protein
VDIQTLPAHGRLNFRAICGAGGKELGPPLIELDNISKVYTLPGRDEEVCALRSITMMASSEIYPILRGEFVVLRGPSGGGAFYRGISQTRVYDFFGTTKLGLQTPLQQTKLEGRKKINIAASYHFIIITQCHDIL